MRFKGLKIFTEVFSKVFISFIIIMLLLAYIITIEEINEAIKYILEEHKIVGNFVSRLIEISYEKSEMPFEILNKLTQQHSEFLFWWIVQSDGNIYLANKASFMKTNAYSYFPKMGRKIIWDKDMYLDYNNRVGIFINPLNIEGKNWSFWLGFSLNEVFKKVKETILVISILFFILLVLLAISVYFGIRKSLDPIKSLIEGIENYARGNFSYRIKIKSKNEIGQLGNYFNKMAENLEKITVSRDVLAKEIEEREKIEMQLRANEQQLKALNQQLLANEQQLKASNQQLLAEIENRKKIDEERKKYLHELEVFYKASIDREERILELKKRIKELEELLKNKS